MIRGGRLPANGLTRGARSPGWRAAAWLLVLASAPAAGATPAAVELADGLSLAEAIALAQAADPERKLRLWQTEEQEALGKAEAEAAWDNPELRLEKWKAWESSPEPGEQREAAGLVGGMEVALRWSPPRPGEKPALTEAGQRRAEAARWFGRREQQLLSFRVGELFLQLLGAEAVRALAAEEVELRGRLAEMVQSQLAAGSATGVLHSQAVLDRWDATAELLELELERDKAWVALAALTGLAGPPPALDPSLLEAPCELPPGTDEAMIVRRALLQRPDLAAIRRELSAAESELRAASRSRLFWPRWFQLGYEIGDPGKPDTLELGLAFELPLLDDRMGDVQEQAALRDRQQALLEAQAGLVAFEVRDALAVIRVRKATLAALERARPSTESALALVTQAIAAGQSDPLALAKIKEKEARLRKRWIEAKLDCQLALLNLQLALGEPEQTPLRAP